MGACSLVIYDKLAHLGARVVDRQAERLAPFPIPDGRSSGDASVEPLEGVHP